MILETERLILRKFKEDDLEALGHLLADEEVMRFSLMGPIREPEKVAEYLQKILDHYAQYGFGLWAVIHKGDGDLPLMGYTGLRIWQIEGEDEIELGYRFHPRYWGHGFATEAARAVCRYAFNDLKIDSLISVIEPKNIRSIQVALRVGMQFQKETFFYGIHVQIYGQTAPC